MAERHGTCTKCFRGVHEWPTGWAHVQTSPGQDHTGWLVRVPVADVRDGDIVVRERSGDAWIKVAGDV